METKALASYSRILRLAHRKMDAARSTADNAHWRRVWEQFCRVTEKAGDRYDRQSEKESA